MKYARRGWELEATGSRIIPQERRDRERWFKILFVKKQGVKEKVVPPNVALVGHLTLFFNGLYILFISSFFCHIALCVWLKHVDFISSFLLFSFKSHIQYKIRHTMGIRGGYVKGRGGPRALSPNSFTFVLALKINLLNI